MGVDVIDDAAVSEIVTTSVPEMVLPVNERDTVAVTSPVSETLVKRDREGVDCSVGVADIVLSADGDVERVRETEWDDVGNDEDPETDTDGLVDMENVCDEVGDGESDLLRLPVTDFVCDPVGDSVTVGDSDAVGVEERLSEAVLEFVYVAVSVPDSDADVVKVGGTVSELVLL